MTGTDKLDRGQGKARASFFQIVTGFALAASMIVAAVGCAPSEPEPAASSGTTPTANADGKGGADTAAASAEPGPGAATANEQVGSKLGGK